MDLDENKRKQMHLCLTTVILGLTSLASLGISAFAPGLDTEVRVGLLAITMTSSGLMFLTLRDKGFSIETPMLKIQSEEIKAHKRVVKVKTHPIETRIGIDPNLFQNELMSEEERNFRTQIFKMIEKAKIPSDYEKILNLHEDFERRTTKPVSWMHYLNKARSLAYLQRWSESEKIARKVIEQFKDNHTAQGMAYELLYWVAELLNKDKTEFARQAVEHLPNNYPVLMNAFENAVDQKDTSGAMKFLTEAILADKRGTQQSLSALPVLEEAKKLSQELNKMINEVLKGGAEMNFGISTNLFETIKKQIVFLIIIITLLAGIYQTTITPQKVFSLYPKFMTSLTSIASHCKSGGTIFSKFDKEVAKTNLVFSKTGTVFS